jgi:hypothetical protein
VSDDQEVLSQLDDPALTLKERPLMPA